MSGMHASFERMVATTSSLRQKTQCNVSIADNRLFDLAW